MIKDEFIVLVKTAKDAAMKAVTVTDGGSCNLDLLYIKTKPSFVPEAISILKSEGLTSGTEGKGWIRVHAPDSRWQGWNRTLQVEAMRDVFIKAGIDAFVKYVLD